MTFKSISIWLPMIGMAFSFAAAQSPTAEEIVSMARRAGKGNRKELRSFKLQTYSKSILKFDDDVSGIQETRGITLRHSTVHFEAPDRRYEVITAQRHLQNLKWIPYDPFDLGVIVDFSLDRITIGSVSVVGPLSKDGRRWYEYSLEGEDTFRNGTVCDVIRVRARDRYQPLMEGRLWITREDRQLAKADVRFNEAVKIFPQPRKWTLVQEFEQKSGVWLPHRVQWNMSFDLRLVTWKRKATWTSEQIVYESGINGAVDKSLFLRREKEMAPDAQFKDSTFWSLNQTIPLTADESTAFEKLAQLSENAKVVYPDIESFEAKQREENVHVGFRFRPDGRYNRVEGFFAGAEIGVNNFSYRQLIRDLTLNAAYGYGFADDRHKYSGEIRKGFFHRTLSVGARAYDDITFKELNGNFLSNSITALLYRYDGLNYFYIRGYDVYARWKPNFRWQTEVRFTDRRDDSTSFNTSYALIKRFMAFEPVYPITAGHLRRISLSSTWKIGEGEGIASRSPYWIINATVDYSNPGLIQSDFNYSRLYSTTRFHFPTTRRGSLDGKIYLGLGTNRVPQQYLFDLTGEYPPYVMKTTDILESEGNHFAGNYLAQLCLEHNFGGTILEKTGLPYLKNGDIDITPFINVGYVNLTKAARSELAYTGIREMDKPLVETGFGIGDIHRIIRIDFAWRLTRRQVGNRNFSIVMNMLLQHQ